MFAPANTDQHPPTCALRRGLYLCSCKTEDSLEHQNQHQDDKTVFCFCGSELAAGFAAAKRDSLRHASGLLFLQSWVFVGVKSTGILQEQITAEF